MTDIRHDLAKKAASRRAAEAFERKSEKHFRSERELPPGRDFRWNKDTGSWAAEAEDKYRANFDNIFPNAPGVGI